jgi:hypothetical protein
MPIGRTWTSRDFWFDIGVEYRGEEEQRILEITHLKFEILIPPCCFLGEYSPKKTALKNVGTV